MATLHLDVTKTVADGIHTGIQRVVRQVVPRAMRLGAATGILVVPVITDGSRYYRLNAAGEAALASRGPAGGVDVFAPQPPAVRAAKRFLGRAVPHLYERLMRRADHRRMAAVVADKAEPRPIGFAPGDAVVLMESPFGGPPVDGMIAAQWTGVNTIVLVHDIIAVTDPDTVTPFATWRFRRALLALAPRSRGILTVSRDVARRTTDYLGAHGIGVRTAYFHLGYDLAGDGSASSSGTIPDVIWAAGEPVFVMLGNIDVRKGQAFVLDAFDRLWADGVAARLLVIGKAVGGMTAFLDRCAHHSQRGERLFLVHDASDADVAAAMRRSTAGIIAATAEGFGLPLVEFLATGLPVLASDIPVFREIAEGHALFFDRGDPANLAEKVAELIRDPVPAGRAAAAFRWIDWDQATERFMAAVEELLAPDATGLLSPSRPGRGARQAPSGS